MDLLNLTRYIAINRAEWRKVIHVAGPDGLGARGLGWCLSFC